MEFWAFPYLIWYLAMFFFWMLAMHRQVLFWLYLWQLKEYHLGRFLAHFETQKGKSVFISPLFLGKIAVLVFACGYYYFLRKFELIIGLVLVLYLLQGLRAFWGILRRNLLHPEITQKSLVLIGVSHFAVFVLGAAVFALFLGEMSLLDFAFAAFCLLAIDILLPIIVSLVVLGLQPITIWKKNKTINQARAIIEKRSDLLVIGITGSFGKSGVKELLSHILSKKYKVLKTKANQNTEMGVSQTIIDNLKPEHQVFVCEMGAVHKGKIAQTASIVKPKIGILTGINQQHLGVFGSQKNIIDAKFELLESLPENGATVLNFVSQLICNNFDSKKDNIKSNKIIFAGKDIFASDIKATADNLSFTLNYQNQKIAINANAKGAWMADTIILSIASAIAAGMKLSDIAQTINQTDFAPFNIRLVEVSPRQACLGDTSTHLPNLTIIDSTYSSNPDGVMAHLDYLKIWEGGRVVIMPCLIELGKESKKIHFEIGKKIGEVCDIAIIATKDRFGEIKKGALSARMLPENIIFCDNPKKIADLIKNRLSDGDIVLLEGRLSQEINALFKKNSAKKML